MFRNRCASRYLAWAAVFGVILCAGPAGAQLTPGLEDDPYLVVHDYWNREHSRATWEMVRNVERYHLDDANFWTEYRAGHLDYARSGIVFVLKYVPNHPKALHLLGVLSRQMNDISYPIPYFERALRLLPGHAYTRAQYGEYLGSIGQREAGARELREALLAEPDLLVAKAWLESLAREDAAPLPPVTPHNVRP
jgi:tetratricopeptide (TPR) repeat protein